MNDTRLNVNFATRYRDLNLLKRRWFPLWHLDWYVFREFMLKYTILLTLFAIIFFLSDALHDLGSFIENNAELSEIALYFLYKLPGNIRFVLPISILLSSMWTMALFGKNLEVTAMRASGVSLPRCAMSIFAIGLLTSIVNVYLNEYLVPTTTPLAEAMQENHKRGGNNGELYAFRSTDKKRRWVFTEYLSAQEQHNVRLETTWDTRWIRQLLGEISSPAFKERAAFILGRKIDYNAEGQELLPALQKKLLDRKMALAISESRYDTRIKCWKFTDVSIVSYERPEEKSFRGTNEISAIHQPLYLRETVIFSDSGLLKETPGDIVNALQELDQLSTPVILDILHKNPEMSDRIRCQYETVFFHRIAFPWASFLAVFLGIPLATKNERNSSVLAVLIAIALIVIYVVLAHVGQTLGKGGFIPPWLGGLAPTIGFIAAAGWRLMSDRN